jgi:hypothetical protein
VGFVCIKNLATRLSVSSLLCCTICVICFWYLSVGFFSIIWKSFSVRNWLILSSPT